MSSVPINIFPPKGDPINIVMRMEKKPSQADFNDRNEEAVPGASAEESMQEKIKRVASYFIIGLGLLLMANAFGLLVGQSMGILLIAEPSVVQTVFICGLSAVLGGCSLQNSDYKGALTLAHPGLPFTFNLHQK